MNAPHIISPCTRAGSSILHVVHLHLLFAKRFSKAVNTPPFHQIPKRTQLLRPGDITLAPRLLLSVYTVSSRTRAESSTRYSTEQPTELVPEKSFSHHTCYQNRCSKSPNQYICTGCTKYIVPPSTF